MDTDEIRELSMEEKEQVSGGTVTELEELATALFDTNVGKGIVGAGTHVPIGNGPIVDDIKSTLSDLGIDADISTGFLGTGIGSSHNTYTVRASGQQISHQDVVNILKKTR